MLPSADSCGMLYNMTKALNIYSDKYEAIYWLEKSHPFRFPHAILYENLSVKEIEKTFDEVDFIQIAHTHYPEHVNGVEIPMYKIKSQYHTGFHYREFHEKADEMDRKYNIPVVFATPDLCRFNEDLIPLRYPIDTKVIYNKYSKNNKSMVVHSPSSSVMKGTELVDFIVSPVSHFFEVSYVSTRDIMWEDSLLLKSHSIIYVDHMYKPYGSFGISSVEAATVGAIPIAYGKDFNMKDCPFISVNNEQELWSEVSRILRIADYRYKKSKDCQEWALDNFSLEITAKQLEEDYGRI